MHHSLSRFKALSILLVLGIIWGSGYSIARYAMTHGVSPLGYSFWQALGPAILLLLVSILLGKFRDKPLKISVKMLPYFLICGLLGIAIPNSNMYFTAAHLPAGVLALLVNTVPLFVYPLACILKQERVSIRRALGVLIGFLGVVYLSFPGNTWQQLLLSWHSTNHWATLTLISPVCFALCSLYIAARQNTCPNIYIASIGMLLTASILLTPLVFATHSFYALWPINSASQWIVLLEIVLSSAGYLLFFYLIQNAGPVYYSFVGGIVGLTGVVWGYVLFGEHLIQSEMVALICIITAIGLVSWTQE